jgi:hypothetical protein
VSAPDVAWWSKVEKQITARNDRPFRFGHRWCFNG